MKEGIPTGIPEMPKKNPIDAKIDDINKRDALKKSIPETKANLEGKEGIDKKIAAATLRNQQEQLAKLPPADALDPQNNDSGATVSSIEEARKKAEQAAEPGSDVQDQATPLSA